MKTALLTLGLVACAPPPDATDAPDTTTVLPDPIRRTGDPAAGWDYLRYGDFVGSGIPLEVWQALPEFVRTSALGPPEGNPLERTGDSADVPRSFNVFDAPNGERVMGGLTCLGCHSGTVRGQFIVGISDPDADYTASRATLFETVATLLEPEQGQTSRAWDAFEPFYRAGVVAAPQIITPFVGVNPAFVLEEAAAAHRDPATLVWSDRPAFEVAAPRLASDAPAWWHLRKKNALYVNGMGRGDLGTLLMQVMVPAIPGVQSLDDADAAFDNVYAMLANLEPPPFPGPIDDDAAAAGSAVFAQHCARCHGTYGDEPTYPNLLVQLDEVGTDGAYAERFVDTPNLADWFAQSWFADRAQLDPQLGYVAPPLDGLWATAPYFHNGSVPTVAGVLDSTSRPARWRRSATYDDDALGWQHDRVDTTGPDTYDTERVGYGRQGHTYGDGLSEAERRDLIAYLKTL